MLKIKNQLRIILDEAMEQAPMLMQEELDHLYSQRPIDDLIKQSQLFENQVYHEATEEIPAYLAPLISKEVQSESRVRAVTVGSTEYEEALDLLNTEVEQDFLAKKIQYRVGRSREKYLNDRVGFHSAETQFMEYLQSCSWQDFELLCGATLHLLGYQDVNVTQQVGDGGIDFLATHVLSVGESSDSFLKLLFVGQAKRYNNKVGIADIRDFLGATEMLRCGAYWNASPELTAGKTGLGYVMPFGALARLMIVSNSFTSDASKFAEDIGIRCIDGKELARIFHTFEIGFSRTRVTVTFDKKVFAKRIASMCSAILCC